MCIYKLVYNILVYFNIYIYIINGIFPRNIHSFGKTIKAYKDYI